CRERAPGHRPAAPAGRNGSPRGRGCSLLVTSGRLRAVVPARLLVAAEVEVVVELQLVGGEHVRRLRDPRELDHLERNDPAVVRALERRDRLDRLAEQLLELLARALGRVVCVAQRRALDRLLVLLFLFLLLLLLLVRRRFGLGLRPLVPRCFLLVGLVVLVARPERLCGGSRCS